MSFECFPQPGQNYLILIIRTVSVEWDRVSLYIQKEFITRFFQAYAPLWRLSESSCHSPASRSVVWSVLLTAGSVPPQKAFFMFATEQNMTCCYDVSIQESHEAVEWMKCGLEAPGKQPLGVSCPPCFPLVAAQALYQGTASRAEAPWAG